MRCSKVLICRRIALSVIVLALFRHESAYSQELAEIHVWVARQMNIDDVGPLPAVRYVGKAELQAVFANGNRNAYLRWEARYGARQAEKIMNVYLEEIVGMFDPRTELIYVGRFLSLCRQQAILAHEIAHYFQHRRHRLPKPDDPGAEKIQMKYEMEACAIEQRYNALFCEIENMPRTP